MNGFMLSAVAVISLSAGMAVYRFGLFWFLHRPLRFREWSHYLPFYVAFGVAVLLVYLPVFWWLRERSKRTHPMLVLPLAGALLGMAPILGLRLWGEARLAHARSAEALLVYGLFVTAGFVFGLFYPLCCED